MDSIEVNDNPKSEIKLVQNNIVLVQKDGSINIDSGKTPVTNNTYSLIFDL